MIVLLHVLYIYAEYLWSCLVNRNRLSAESCGINSYPKEGELKLETAYNHVDNETISTSTKYQSEVEDVVRSDNLEIDTGNCSDRYTFRDNFDEFDAAAYDPDSKKITFFPPVYIQRYVTVANILKDDRWKNEIKKVVDIGCSELGFFKFLKDVDGVEKILAIDIDKKLLQEYSYRIQPWVSDYMKDRHWPLEVELLCGNVSRPDCHLEEVDAVIGIELIEHLYPPDLDALPLNIFGVIQPRIAIFTTPNEEFNVLFDNFSGFRHDDHKFEWNRGEFESWAKNICCRFKNFEVNFFGIGPGPSGSENHGCCSQGAVFIRNYSLPVENYLPRPLNSYLEYEVIDELSYPYRRDERSQDKITFDDAQNFINLAVKVGDYHNGERIEIPLATVLMRVNQTCKSVDKLKHILEEESDYKVEKDKDGDFVVVVPEPCFSSESEDDINCLPGEENLQYVEHVVGVNDIVTDEWGGVNQDDVSWVSDDNYNQLDDISAVAVTGHYLDDEKECAYAFRDDILSNVDEIISVNNSDFGDDEACVLDGTFSNYGVENSKCLESGELSYRTFQTEKSVSSYNNKSDFDGIENTLNICEELVDLGTIPPINDESQVIKSLKHSRKFLSSDECKSFDENEINTSYDNCCADLFSERFTYDEEKEITSTILNSYDNKNSSSSYSSSICEKQKAGFVNDYTSYSDMNSFQNLLSTSACSSSSKLNFECTSKLVSSSDPDKNFICSASNNLELKPVENLHEKSELSCKDNGSFFRDNLTFTGNISNEISSTDVVANFHLKSVSDKFLSPVVSIDSHDQSGSGSILTVGSAYQIDECIESVQEIIKKFDGDCFNNKKLNESHKESSAINSDNLKVLKKDGSCMDENSTPYKGNAICTNSIVSDKLNCNCLTDIKNESLGSVASSNCSACNCVPALGNYCREGGGPVFNSKECQIVNELKSKFDSFNFCKDSVNVSCLKSIDCVKKNNLLEVNSSNTTTSTSCSSEIETVSCSEDNLNNFSVLKTSSGSTSPISVKCCYFEGDKSSCKYSDADVEINLDLKTSETCNYNNGKLCAYYCLNCSALSSNFLSPSKAEFNDDHKSKQCDQSITTASTSNNKTPENLISCGKLTFSSDSLLFSDQNEEVVIRTHYFETDKSTINEFECTSSNLISNTDELKIDEGRTFGDESRVCEKNYGGVVRSHSLEHFDQYSFTNNECIRFMKSGVTDVSKDVIPQLQGELIQKLDFKRNFDNQSVSHEEDYDDDDGGSVNDSLHTGMERQDSFSPDKAGDSGYPNSNSGRDMEMDLTPEQVKEIMTEGESSLENSPLDSPVEEAAAVVIPHPLLVHLGDNVENGDVANNNRDGEGNNMIGQAAIVGEPLEFHALIDHPQEMPLMAVAGFDAKEGFYKDCNGDDANDNKNCKSESDLEDKTEECTCEQSENISPPLGYNLSRGSYTIDKKGAVKRSKTFLDVPSTFKSDFSKDNVVSERKNMEIDYRSYPDSALKQTNDEAELNSIIYCNSIQSFDTLKNSELMVESYNIKKLNKYAAFLAQKSPLSVFSVGNSSTSYTTDSSSVLPSDSPQSCSSSTSTVVLSRSHLPQLSTCSIAGSETSSSDIIDISLPQNTSTMPMSSFNEALDTVIRDVVDELMAPNSEPFADWLLQIQLELITVEEAEGDHNLNTDNGYVRVAEQVVENDNEAEYIVEADIKGGGDNTVDYD